MCPRWLTQALTLFAQGTPAVLVRVIGTRGSAPRDAGTRMIVTGEQCLGTIGGGNLEYRAIAQARELLNHPDQTRLHRYPLGASLGQCCGGLVQLLFEPLTEAVAPRLHYLHEKLNADQAVILLTRAEPPDEQGNSHIEQLLISQQDRFGTAQGFDTALLERAQAALTGPPCDDIRPPALQWFELLRASEVPLWVFGAGHVGKALIHVLSTLPCEIRWIDSRADEFPESLPPTVLTCLSEHPEQEIDSAPAGCHVLVLTHNHALDERICAAALNNPDVAWCGLIGSASKRRRFLQRLQARGISDTRLARCLCCPIGDPSLGNKHPGEIAISVAAQILQLRQRALAEPDVAPAPCPTTSLCQNS